MDLRKIKKLIDLLEESNLAELEIKEGEEIRAPGAHSQGHGQRARRPRRRRRRCTSTRRAARRRPVPRPAPPSAGKPATAGRPRGARADGRHVLRLAPIPNRRRS